MLDNTPFFLVIFQSLIEAVILISLGLALLGFKQNYKRVVLAGFLAALASYFIKPNLPPGLNIPIQLVIQTSLLSSICRLSLVNASLVCVLGLVTLSFFEICFNFLMQNITGLTIWEVMKDPWLRFLFPLPEFITLGFLVVLINRYRKRIVDWSKAQYPNIISVVWKIQLVVLFVLAVMLIAFGFYYENYLQKNELLSKMFLVNSMYFVVFAAVVLSLLLSQKLLSMERQKKLMQAQQLHIDNLQEMMQVIKAQRHDFVNHIQVVYGLLTLHQVEQAQEYISRLYHDVQVSGDILQLGVPELSALLLVKMGAATGKEISLNIQVETSLTGIGVSSQDLVAVVGNLVNNALEAVEQREPEERVVNLRFFAKSGYIIVQIHNQGWIHAGIRERLFETGFSTKSAGGDRGIGLASVKYLVEKYQGRVLLSSHPQRGTRFTVCYPQSKERRKRYERTQPGGLAGYRPGQGIGQ